MRGSAAPGRAPYPKGPLDLGHQRNVGLVSPTLQNHERTASEELLRLRVVKTQAYHQAKLSLRVPSSATGRVRVCKGGFVPSGDTIRVASPPQRVPEPGPRPRGGDSGTSVAVRREEWHVGVLSVWVIEM